MNFKSAQIFCSTDLGYKNNYGKPNRFLQKCPSGLNKYKKKIQKKRKRKEKKTKAS